MYPFLKHLHVTCAGLSLGLFLLRGGWMVADSPRLRSRFSRIVPHVVDTFLLASAVGLSVLLSQYPFVHGWLTGKFFGLILYIVLGTIALRRGRTRTIRGAAFVGAVIVFVWIGMTAMTHSPWLLPI